MRAIATLAILPLLLLLPAPAASTTSPAPVQLQLTDCHYIESLNFVPGPLVAPYIPTHDFNVAQATQLVVGMADCQATTNDGRSERVNFGWADVQVNPRAALRSPQGGLHLYRIEHLTTNDLYGEIHAAHRNECRKLTTATTRADTLLPQALAKIHDHTVWNIQAPLTPPNPNDATTTHYREYGPSDNGYTYLEGDLINPGTPATTGTFQTDAQSPLHQIWGPHWTSRTITSTNFAIRDTTIHTIPWPTAPTPRTHC